MTLRQQEFIKRLPANGYNMAKTMREVGYSKQTSNSGAQYGLLRAKVEKAFSQEGVKADILKYEKKFIKDGDNSNLARMVELRSKASGLTRDQAIQGVAVNINGVIDTLKGSGQPVDKPINDVTIDTAIGNDIQAKDSKAT